jgi:hypothetical protein
LRFDSPLDSPLTSSQGSKKVELSSAAMNCCQHTLIPIPIRKKLTLLGKPDEAQADPG